MPAKASGQADAPPRGRRRHRRKEPVVSRSRWLVSRTCRLASPSSARRTSTTSPAASDCPVPARRSPMPCSSASRAVREPTRRWRPRGSARRSGSSDGSAATISCCARSSARASTRAAVARDNGETGVALILVDANGENVIVVAPGRQPAPDARRRRGRRRRRGHVPARDPARGRSRRPRRRRSVLLPERRAGAGPDRARTSPTC